MAVCEARGSDYLPCEYTATDDGPSHAQCCAYCGQWPTQEDRPMRSNEPWGLFVFTLLLALAAVVVMAPYYLKGI